MQIFICHTNTHMRHDDFLWPISSSQNKVTLSPCLNISQLSLFSPPWRPPCSQETSAPLPTTLSLTASTDLRSLCLSPGLSEGTLEKEAMPAGVQRPLSQTRPHFCLGPVSWSSFSPCSKLMLCGQPSPAQVPGP